MVIYLIDGNNVLRSNLEWNKLFEENPENAKDFFMQKLIDYFKDTKNQATVFFDGFKFTHSFSKLSSNVNIKHSKNKTADETILITIQKEKNKKNIVVVTNDIELGSKARLNQCKVISADEFVRNLSSAKKSDKDKPENPNDSEIQYFLRLFERNDGK